MRAFSAMRSHTLVLPQTDIDTDQIIPARFLTTTSREGLGRHAFADWRLDSTSPINQPNAQRCRILVAGHNFGCGSSREHAPWALLDFGFRVVISTRIADIFRANALNNGLLAIEVNDASHAWLLRNPGARVEVDLEHQIVRAIGHFAHRFEIDPFARHCLLKGQDTLDVLCAAEPDITAYESRHA